MMDNEMITDLPLEDLPTIEESQLNTPVFPKRRDRAAEREQKLRKNARLFYRVYFICIAAVLCILLILMIPLRSWLVRFESTQPDNYSQQVFSDLFAQKNWGAVYDAAKLEDTDFETREDFIAYMQAKAKDKDISFYETSAGLSKDHKYIVQLGNEKIATFFLAGQVNEKTKKTDWSISSLELEVSRNHSVTVQRLPGYTVLINGKEASSDYLSRSITTRAEEYLPAGVHGYTLEELYVDNLMTPPTVEVKDANGNTVPTIFSVADNTYKLDLPVALMTDTERDIILGAAKANALFAIRAVGTSDLSKYFDYTSQIYKDICNTPTFIQSFASYRFDESVTAISDFYRYSDDLFSARVTLQLDITRKNGTVKSLEMNTTYIFTKNASGNFMVSNITNVDLQEQVQQVRLTFDCDGTILDTQMVDTTATSVTTPLPTVPEGQVFLGWATRKVESNGQITMNILFVPDEAGAAQVSAELEPITLYAVFGEEEAASNG